MAATYNSISRRLSIYLNGLLVQSMFADPPDVYTNTSTADIGHSFLETWKQSLPGKVRCPGLALSSWHQGLDVHLPTGGC